VNTTPIVTATSNSPVNSGGTLNLSASGATSYTWTGPNGYTATGSAPSITNAATVNSGIYNVTGRDNGCFSSASTSVAVNAYVPATGLNFDGVDDYVQLGNLLSANQSYTKEAWVYANDSHSANILSSPDAPIWLNAGHISAAHGFTASNYTVTDPAIFPLGTWVHIAVTYDAPSTTLTIYKNGAVAASSNAIVPYAAGPFQLGAFNTSNFFNGSMDEVRIWNRALCQAEIQNNKDCELNAAGQTGLLSLYHFNQGLAGGDNTPVTVTAPGAPTINSVTAGNGSVTVNFTAPSSNGGSPVTSYSVTSTPGGAVQSGTGSPIIFSGLTNGTPYTFTITATNVAGTSAPSASSGSAIPVGVPSAPSITNVVSGNAQVTVNFIAPSSNGGSSILDYTVTSTPGGFTKTGSASPLIVSGLTNGQSYIFTVKARNANGFGASSPASSSIIPATVPAVGQILSVTGGDASAIVSFSLTTSDGGSHITKYVITANPGGLSQNANTSPYTFTGLTNGNFYTFTVKAVNALGISLPSAASNPPTLIRSLAKRVMIEYNNALGADIDVSTGWALAADQSEYEPFTYEPMLAAPAIPYTVIRPNIVNNQNYILTYDTSDNLYIGQDYLSFFPGDFNEFFNSNGDPTPIDTDITGVFLITTDLYLVDAQTQTQLYDPVTLQGIAFTDDFQVLPTPYSLQPSYAAAHNLQAQTKPLSIPPTANGYVMVNPKIPVDSKTGVVITNATAPAENTVKAATISANGNPLYVTGPYSYGNATAADQIELSGNIAVDDLNHTIGLLTVTDAAPSNNITVTNILIDETGNNNGVLSNFALTGNTSNWTTGIAAGTCAPFVAPTTPVTGNNVVCVGSTTALSNATAGGIWSSNNTSVATVSATGVVNGVSVGTSIISYTNNCGGISTATVTVSALPVATISKTDAITACPGSTVRLQANTGSGLTYQWQNNGADIRGATASGYAATANGTYAVVITNGNNCVSPVSNSIAVTLQDITAPVAPVLPDVTAQCSATVSAPTATDACSGIVTGTTTDSVNYHTQGSFVIHWKFTDASNNSSFADQHVFIRDVTPPVIVCQPDITVTAASALGSVVNYTEPVGTDNCSSTTTRTAGLASGSTFPIGTTRVTYTVTDVAGLTANCSFNVTVAGLAPSINCPVDITVSNATDQCGNRVDFAATERTGIPASTITYSIAPGSFFGIGTTAVTATATNAVGSSSCTFNVTVTDDQYPVFDAITNISVNNDSGKCGASINISTPTATDNCRTPVVTGVRSDGLLLTDDYPTGTTVITWTATDVNNNTTTATQNITVKDNEAPVPDVAILRPITGECSAGVTVPTAMDNCAGKIRGRTSDPTSYKEQGTYTITWSYDDGNGNISTQTQTVIIADTTAPVPDQVTLPTVTGECSVTINATAASTVPKPDPKPAASPEPKAAASAEPPAKPSGPVGTPVPGSGGVTVDPPTATDNCTGRITATTTDPLTYTVQGSYIIYWIYTDGNGNVSAQEQTVIVRDVTAPVADNKTLPPVTGERTATITDTPTATDNCAGTITGSTTDSLTYSTQGVHTITWSFDDRNGNVSTQTQTVIVKDVTAPVADNETLRTVTGECTATVTDAPTATDNCAGTITGTTTDPLTYSTQGTYTITWSYDDRNGNVSTQTQTVIVKDTTAPVVPILETVTGECSATATIPTTRDNCSGVITGTTSDSLTYTAQGTYAIHWTFDDGNGNTSTTTQTVIVKDVTAPMVPVLANVTGECSATATVPTTRDNCAGVIRGTTSDSLTYTAQGTYTIHWTFDDGNGNTSTTTQTVIVKDVTAPIVPVLANVTGECSATATVPTTRDNCAGVIRGTTSDSLTYTAQGTYTIHWTFDDGNGNTSTTTQTVIVKDVTPPTISCPGNISVYATSAAGAVVNYTAPVVTDNCAGVTTVRTSGLASNSTFPIGTTTVTHTVTDIAGLTAQCSFTVTVAGLAPVINCPSNIIVTNTTDQCGANVSFAATETTAIPASVITYSVAPGSFFAIGTTTVVVTATNAVGSSTCRFTVTVTDSQFPVLVGVPVDIIVECSAIPAAPLVTATDNCSTSVPSYTETRTNGSCLYNYTLTRTWSTTDANGNTTAASQVITVVDRTAPVLSAAPVNVTVECNAVPTAAVLTATDNCGTASVAMTETRTNGNCINNYTLTRTWTATDLCGNTSSATQIITVVDRTAPVLSAAPVNVTVECNAVPTAAVLTATDNCGTASVAMTETRTNGNCINNYTLTRTWTATDLCGNTSSVSQTITVSDHTAPVLSAAPVNVTVECDAVPTAAVLTATDNCGAATVTMVETRTNGNYPRNYTLTRLWTATDLCGNTSSTKTQVITVQDTKAPVPVIASLPILSGDCSVTAIAPTANDNCAGTVTATTVNPVTYTAQGVYTITWNYNDGNGNATTQLQRIVVKDVTPPVPNLTMLPTVTGQCSATVSTKPTATDLCAGLLTGTTTDPLTYNTQGTYTIHWTYTDKYNNKTVQLQTVIVKDNIEPVVNVATLPTVTGQCSASIVITNAGRCTDNCACCRDFCRCRSGSNCNCHRNDGWNYGDWWNNLFGDDNDGCDFDSNSDAYYMSAPTATDNCKGTIVGTTTDPLTYNNQGTYTIHWNFNDGNGNTTVQTQQVVVQDNQAPIVWQSQLPTLYGQCSVNLSSNSNDWSWWDDDDDDNGYGFTAPWAWDNCAGWIQATTADPTSYTTQGTFTIHWTFNDGHGNITTQNQTVIVKDNVAPRATVSNLPTISGQCSVTVTTKPTASDNCAGTITATTVDPLTYTMQGTYTIHWSYNDGHGNITTQNQVVVVKDNTAPVATLSSLPTVSGNCSVSVTTVPTANDNCKGTITGTTTDPLTYTTKGSYTIHWKYDDGNGNVTTQNQTVTVIDATPPVPQVATLPTITGSCNVTVSAIPKANDVCGGVITATTNSALTYNTRGTYTITWTYNDGNGNSSTQTQTVNVVDVTAPTLTVPANTTISCGGSSNPSSTGTATATDNCSGVVSITYSDVTTGNTITRTWKATDAAGNISTGTQTITSVDNTKPTITDPKDVTVSCGTSILPSATGTATATDNCSTPTVTYGDVTSGNIITRTWTATDAAGNSSSSTQVITIVDNTKPTISDPADVTVNCGASTLPSATGTATATDNCSTPTVTYSDLTSGNTITRTWKATDASGNYATSTQVITIGSAFSASVTSVPTNSTYTGGVSTNLYIGYGAQSTALQMCSLPSAGAPYTYSWSCAYSNMLNSTTTASPVFTPTTFGYYTFNVTVTNKYGCTSTASISICVTDIRVPGTSGANLKVYVCHSVTSGHSTSTQTLQVLISQVPSHIGNNTCGSNGNDRLGSCDQSPCNITVTNSNKNVVTATKEGASSEVSTSEDELKVTVMPNPTTTFFTLKLESKYETPVNMRVMDARGRVIDARSKIGANSTIQIGHNYSSGTYYAELIQGNVRKVVQMIKGRG